MKIKILLLDIGGIFFYPAWRMQGISEVSSRLHVNTEELKTVLEKYKKPFYTGKMSETEYWNETLDALKIHNIESSELELLYRKYVKPIPEALNLLPKLSSKFTLLSFNNSPKEWMDYRRKLVSLDKYFSEFFTSGYLGYMKPDNDMYEKVITSYDKNELFYLDDNEQYVSIAQDKYGIIGKKYQNYADLSQLMG